MPVGATSVVFNLTATQPTAGGFLTVFPSNAARPLVASVDFIAGQTATINTTAKVGADGAIKIFNHGATPT